MIRSSSPVCFLLVVAACSGGGSDTAAAAPGTVGSVQVVVDTATGSRETVQVQVVGAVLETAGGATTGNLLAAPRLLTIADPSGEPDALELRAVPGGDYERLRLVTAPGSGAVLSATGGVRGTALAAELEIPFVDPLHHAASGRSWLEIGHDGVPPGTGPWQPVMSARGSGSACRLDGLRVAAVDGAGVTVTWGDADLPLHVEFAAGCRFEGEGGMLTGGRDDFLRDLGRGHDLAAEGDLHHQGRFVARHLRRQLRGHDGPRLIGRIAELRPATGSFVMDVLAEVRRGHRRFLATPNRVLVLAGPARITWSHTARELTFAELQVDQLAKVEWSARAPGSGGLEELTARAIEVTGPGAPMRPQWQGSVQGVDVVLGTIVVVPRHGDPIVVQGQAVTAATVHVDGNTVIERRERHGPGRARIPLAEIVPGQDRIWWRGEVTGPTTIDATWVRVRQDD